MLTKLLGLLTGPIVDAVVGIWKSNNQRKMTEAEMTAAVQKAVVGAISSVAGEAAQVIMAETKSEDWLTRNWRPIVALTAFFSYWYVILAVPHLVAWGWLPGLRFGEVGLQNLFQLAVICVGGYVGGRTLEKVATTAFGAFRRR